MAGFVPGADFPLWVGAQGAKSTGVRSFVWEAKAPTQRAVPSERGGIKTHSEEAQWSKVAEAAVRIFEENHYSKSPLNREFSRRAFERYLDVLDPDRSCFLRADVERLKQEWAEVFVEGLQRGSLKGVDAVEGVRAVRLAERALWVAEFLGEPWDFSDSWMVEDSRENANWPEDEAAGRRVWREQIGADLLLERLEGASAEQAVERVRRRHEAFFEEIERGYPQKVGAALMGFARAFDAHSDYLSQEEFEANEGELHLTRVGIGVTLDRDPKGLRVVGISPGGPAQKDGRLRVNDRITAVGEDGKTFKELVDLPFEERVRLLRGQRGGVVYLKLAARNASEVGARLVIGLRREEMRSRDGEVYAKCVELAQGDGGSTRVGWIVVPAFYGEEADGRGLRSSSVSRDVSALVRRLKAERVGGIVLDLRGNAGGLLDEAVELGGLFCGRVPIAMVRAPREKVEVLLPEGSQKPLYEGPLVVLVNNESASASELLAAALQDHRRAVVVGGEKTFGKGTVQAPFQIGEYLHSKFRSPVGGVLVTLGKFYRVSGQSTQLIGVKPDVVLPSTLDLPGRGESSLVNPLPHDSVSPLWGKRHGGVTDAVLNELRLRSLRRLEVSAPFRQIASEKERLKKEYERNRVSLMETERRQERERLEVAYANRQREALAEAPRSVYSRLGLGDLKLKVLPRGEEDFFKSPDPEWFSVEVETLSVIRDLAGMWKSGR